MPLARKQIVSNQSGAAVASLAVTLAQPAQNNLLVATAGSDSTLTMTSGGWLLATSAVNAVGLYQWYKVAGSAESTTVTVTPTSSTSVELSVQEFTGAVTVSPLDKVASNITAGTVTTFASGTTTATAQADELVLAAFGGNENFGLFTVTAYNNSFVEDYQGLGTGATQPKTTRLAVAHHAVVATGTQTCTATFSANVTNPSALICTYKAAPPSRVILGRGHRGSAQIMGNRSQGSF